MGSARMKWVGLLALALVALLPGTGPLHAQETGGVLPTVAGAQGEQSGRPVRAQFRFNQSPMAGVAARQTTGADAGRAQVNGGQFGQYPGGQFGGGQLGGQFGGGIGGIGGGGIGGIGGGGIGGIGGGIGGIGGGFGRQGGFGMSSLQGTMPPGGTVQIAAYCTDLFLGTPDETTRFAAASDAGEVQLASGDVLGLREALEGGFLVLRGRDPMRESGLLSCALKLVLTNASPQPVRIAIRSGSLFTPVGQSVGPVPEGMDRLLKVKGAARAAGTATMACAVWAARGSTREDVEETLMTSLTSKDAEQVQQLLDLAQIKQSFDRERGAYEKLYRQTLDKMRDVQEMRGQIAFKVGSVVPIEALKAADGQGVVTLHPKGASYPLRYAATYRSAGPRRLVATLKQPKTGRPLEAFGGELHITLEG
jgi:hypothetical protein